MSALPRRCIGPCCAGLLLLPAALHGEGLRVEAIVPQRASCDHAVSLEVRGAHLVGEHQLLLQLWQGSGEQRTRGVSLTQLQPTDQGQLRAVLPAGAAPGNYRLVVVQRAGKDIAERFSELTFAVEPPPPGATFVTGVTSFLLTAGKRLPVPPPGAALALPDHPTRLALLGAHVDRLEQIWIEGPARLELVDLLPQHPCRLLATLPGGAPPGLYALRGRARGGEVIMQRAVQVLEPGPPEAGLTFLIYFGVLGGVFLLGMLLAWRAGEVGLKTTVARRNLLWQLGGLIAYATVLGLFQFVLANWRG